MRAARCRGGATPTRRCRMERPDPTRFRLGGSSPSNLKDASEHAGRPGPVEQQVGLCERGGRPEVLAKIERGPPRGTPCASGAGRPSADQAACVTEAGVRLLLRPGRRDWHQRSPARRYPAAAGSYSRSRPRQRRRPRTVPFGPVGTRGETGERSGELELAHAERRADELWLPVAEPFSQLPGYGAISRGSSRTASSR